MSWTQLQQAMNAFHVYEKVGQFAISELAACDIDDFTKYMNRAEITQFLPRQIVNPFPRSIAEDLINQNDINVRHKSFLLAIRLAKTGKLIGCIGIEPNKNFHFQNERGTCLLYFWLDPAYWRYHVLTYIMSRLLQHFLPTMFWAQSYQVQQMADDEVTRDTLAKCKFQPVGQQPGCVYWRFTNKYQPLPSSVIPRRASA